MSKKVSLAAIPSLSIDAQEAIKAAVSGQVLVDKGQSKADKKWVIAADMLHSLGFKASMIAGKGQLEGPRNEVESAVLAAFTGPVQTLVALKGKELKALSAAKRNERDNWVSHKSSYVNRIAGYLRGIEEQEAQDRENLSDKAKAAKAVKAKWERRIATLAALAKTIKAEEDTPDGINPVETAKRITTIVGHLTRALSA